jgi:hypothetical protein
VPIHSRLVNAWRNVRDAEKYIWCNPIVSGMSITFSTVQWGFKHVTLQCHFNQPRPFSHYRAKEAFDFDGHRFIEKKPLRHRGILIHWNPLLLYHQTAFSFNFCQLTNSIKLNNSTNDFYYQFTPLRAFVRNLIDSWSSI